MLIAHLFFGLLAGLIAGVWGWVAGLPIWAAVCLYVLGGSLGIAASAAVVFLLARQAAAAREANVPARMSRSLEESVTCSERAIRVTAEDPRRKTSKQGPSGR